MTRKIMACGPIAVGFAVVFASAISDAQAQPIVAHGDRTGDLPEQDRANTV